MAGSSADDFGDVLRGEPCPYLGLREDRQQHYDSAHEKHICWRTGKSLRIDLSHQSFMCLLGSFASCPVYLHHSERHKLLSPHITSHQSPELKPLIAMIALLFTASLLVLGYTALSAFGVSIPFIATREPDWTSTPPGYESFLTQMSPGDPDERPPDLLRSMLLVILTDTPTPLPPTETVTPTATTTPTQTVTVTNTPTGTSTHQPSETSPSPTSTSLVINPTRTPTITSTLRPTNTPTVFQATATSIPETPTLPATTDVPTPGLTEPPPATATDAPPPPTPTEAPPPPPPPTSTLPPTEPPSPTP